MNLSCLAAVEHCRLITEAGRIPVERDTLYKTVTRTEDSFTVAA
jgi:aminodeoxyfutalosine synthase